MKRVILAAMILALSSAAVFAGGGGQSSKSGVPTLTWWCIGDSPSNLQDALKVIGDYIEPKIGTRLDIKVAGWAESGQRFQTIINSGEYYDIMFIDLSDYNRYVGMGAFQDITELVKTASPQLAGFIPPLLWDGVRINGKIYAVPTYKDSSKTRFFVWDDVYVKKYNIDITKVHTYAEMDRVFRAMKAGEGQRFYPLKLSQGGLFDVVYADDYDSALAGLAPIGVGVNDRTRKVVSVFEQPEIMERFKYLHQWYVDGIINPDASVQLEEPKQRPFFHGIGWPAAASIWELGQGVAKYDLEKVFGPMYSTDSIQGSMNAVSANSKYKTEALKFLELVNTDHKLRDMLAYGIEGTNFSYSKPNVVKNLSGTQWNLARYQQGTFFQMSTMEGDPENAWDQIRQQNEQATGSVLLGFAFDNKNVINEVTNCRSVYEKYRVELLTGASDPAAAIPAMMAELQAAGLQKVMDELQKQINAFKF